MLQLIDTHIHLDVPELKELEVNLLPDARQLGIAAFVIPGVRVSGWPGMIELAGQYPGVYAAPGLHPAYADLWNDDAGCQLRKLTGDSRVVAIGEIGLDGAVGPDLKLQEQVLRAQLAIALEAQLPVLLHARKATGRLLDVLDELHIGEKIGGIWHGFSGSLQVAQHLVARGFLIGVGPILLRGNARKLPEAVCTLPLESLVLETDLPDMAEKPEALLKVARRLGELRRVSFDTVVAVTTDNARNLFGLK